MENKKVFCPNCGSNNLQTIVKTDTQTQGKNYSASQGCCGAFLFGPFGLLCGACGQGQKITTTNTSLFACNECGHEFKKREDLVKAVDVAKKAKDLSVPVAAVMSVIIFILFSALEPDHSAGVFFGILLIFGITACITYFTYKIFFENATLELEEYDRQQKKFSDEEI